MKHDCLPALEPEALDAEPHLLARESVERPERLGHERRGRTVDQARQIAAR
jgi:hypothetical protein